MEVGTKGAGMSSAYCPSPKVEILVPRPLGVTTAFFGLRRHHVFLQTTQPGVATESVTAFAKNVKPCVVIYVYFIFKLIDPNSARVKSARHKDDRGDTKMIAKRVPPRVEKTAIY